MALVKRAASIILVGATRAAKKAAQSTAGVQNHLQDPTGKVLRDAFGGETPQNVSRDFKILMVRRSGKAHLMPDAYVFPGGRFDPVTDRNWLKSHVKMLVTDGELKLDSTISRGPGGEILLTTNSHIQETEKALQKWENLPNRPPIFEEFKKELYRTKSQKFARPVVDPFDLIEYPVELSFRMCALRELFEETGILCARSVRSKREFIVSPADLAANENMENYVGFSGEELRKNQQLACQNSKQFVKFCQKYDLIPNAAAALEWSNWLPPSMMPIGNRFDTMFYVAFTDVLHESSVPDSQEITSCMWLDPTEALDAVSSGKLFMAPPQIYEMARLANFNSFDDLRKFAQSREKEGVIRLFPEICQSSDGVFISLLPGDDHYRPTDPNAGGLKVRQLNETAEQSRLKASKLHRMEFEKRWSGISIHANIDTFAGHCLPIKFGKAS